MDAFIEEQLAPGSIPDAQAFWLVRRVEAVSLQAPDIFDLSRETAVGELRRATILRAVYSERQLCERMVEFWSDHFNVFAAKADCAWLRVVEDREVIRRHALGNFHDLLRASATSAAMLTYLDGRTSVAGNPNENHARELLELHTLGVDGGYTQRDVMELSRALTGWRVRRLWHRGRVRIDPSLHDAAAKVVLGERLEGDASRELDRIVDLLSAHPSTALFLSRKLCRRFVGEEPPQELVARTAKAFRESDGSIRHTVSVILHSRELREAPPQFKRPYTFVVSALRALGARTDGGPALVTELARLGQLPFGWPSPDGYPEGESHWRARMLPRWNFALALAGGRLAGTRIEPENPEPRAAAESLLGRPLTRQEERLLRARPPGHGLALLLAHPEFQYC